MAVRTALGPLTLSVGSAGIFVLDLVNFSSIPAFGKAAGFRRAVLSLAFRMETATKVEQERISVT